MKYPLNQMETSRLIIRPYEKNDYDNWKSQYASRLPSHHKYDDGYKDGSNYTKQWFDNWVSEYKELAEKDQFYNLGVFRKALFVNIVAFHDNVKGLKY